MYNITNGRYLYVNKTIKKLLGYEPEEFIKGGLAFVSSLVHPDDMPKIMEKNRKALEEANKKLTSDGDDEPIISFEYRMLHKNGSWRWFQTDGTVYGRSSIGKVELVLNVSIDITERKQAEEQLRQMQRNLERQAEIRSRELIKNLRESEEHFRTLIQAVEDYAIFSVDTSGKITSWNEGVEYILGYKEQEIIGKHYSIL
ncbi:MAG TPA: PAS domain S-box protein, partial [Candidatus Binatia bacterium]|nr:PAS domain S-box protein [Candidatus Binatia bacterium]